MNPHDYEHLKAIELEARDERRAAILACYDDARKAGTPYDVAINRLRIISNPDEVRAALNHVGITATLSCGCEGACEGHAAYDTRDHAARSCR